MYSTPYPVVLQKLIDEEQREMLNILFHMDRDRLKNIVISTCSFYLTPVKIMIEDALVNRLLSIYNRCTAQKISLEETNTSLKEYHFSLYNSILPPEVMDKKQNNHYYFRDFHISSLNIVITMFLFKSKIAPSQYSYHLNNIPLSFPSYHITNFFSTTTTLKHNIINKYFRNILTYQLAQFYISSGFFFSVNTLFAYLKDFTKFFRKEVKETLSHEDPTQTSISLISTLSKSVWKIASGLSCWIIDIPIIYLTYLATFLAYVPTKNITNKKNVTMKEYILSSLSRFSHTASDKLFVVTDLLNLIKEGLMQTTFVARRRRAPRLCTDSLTIDVCTIFFVNSLEIWQGEEHNLWDHVQNQRGELSKWEGILGL